MKSPYGIILGMSGVNPLGTIRSLGSEKIPVVGFYMEKGKFPAMNSKYLERFPEIVKDQEGLLKKLVEFGRNQSEKGVLFPTGDKYLLFCSKNLRELEKYFHVPRTENGELEFFLDKNRNNALGKEAGFKIPWSTYLTQFDSFVEGPIIIKPLTSVETSKKDMVVYQDSKRLLVDKRNLLKKYGEMAIQEYVPGDCRSLVEVHAYNSSKGVIISGMQQNMFSRIMNEHVYGGVIFETIQELELIKPSINLMKNIQFNCPVDINLKKSSFNQEYYFMEFNPRTSSNVSLDTYAGLNLPAIVFKDLTGQFFDDLIRKELKIGVNWVWEQNMQKYLDQGGLKEELIDFLKGKEVVRAIYSSEDPKPFEDINFSKEVLGVLEKIR